MIVSFFESIKYVGHMFPMAFLRIYLGYYYFQKGLDKLQGDFLIQPQLAGEISQWLPQSTAPYWYSYFLESVIVPNWKIFAYTITYVEFLIGIGFICGFLVRPLGILGLLLSLNFYFIYGNSGLGEMHHLLGALCLIMAWLGAGRCLGIDYFFFKRQRGIWW